MIAVRLMGGMGNQMFQYALGRHLAKKHNTELKLDLKFLLDRTPREEFVFRDLDLDLYNINSDVATDEESLPYKYYSSRVTRKLMQYKTKLFNSKYNIIEEKYFHFDSTVLDAPDNSYLIGYWQSYKYFEDIADIIKKEFTFKNDISDKSLEMMEKIKSKNAVCVNIRRADYVDITKATKHHGVIGLDYYKEGSKIIEEKVDNPTYFVFSDDVNWCKENIKLNGEMIVVGKEYSGERYSDYLRLMINCKHYLIPNSTFAWWAAWLNTNNKKIVITPKKWFANLNINTNDLVLGNWIRI